jgi:hypothetical protein
VALQTSGTISIDDLRTEFGDTGSSSLGEFYRGGSLVPNTGTNAAVPTSGTISLSNFYGAAAVAQSWQWVQTYTSMGEGVTRTFQFEDVNDIITSGTFSWSINGTTSDFNAVSGTGTISATSQGSFSITTKNDATTEGTENYILSVSYGGGTILTQSFSVLDTSLTPVTINVARSTTSVNEGSSFTFFATATTAISGSVNFSLGGTATSGSDYTTSGASGSFTFSNSTTSNAVTVSTIADSTTEGSENISCTISSPSASGFDPNVGTGVLAVTINDTSLDPPSYAFTSASYTVAEGSSVTVGVTTTNVPNGTTLYWKLVDSGGDIAVDDGSFTISSNSGSFSVSAIFDSDYSESTESFTLYLRTGSINGTTQDTATLYVTNVGAPSASSGTTTYRTYVSSSQSGAQLLVNARTTISVSNSSSGITVSLDGSETGDGTFTALTTNSGNPVTAYTVNAPGSNLSQWKIQATGSSGPTSGGTSPSTNFSIGGDITDNTYYSVGTSRSTYMEVDSEVFFDNSPSSSEIDWTINIALYFKDSFNNEYGPYPFTVRATATAYN